MHARVEAGAQRFKRVDWEAYALSLVHKRHGAARRGASERVAQPDNLTSVENEAGAIGPQQNDARIKELLPLVALAQSLAHVRRRLLSHTRRGLCCRRRLLCTTHHRRALLLLLLLRLRLRSPRPPRLLGLLLL